jgi:hypothetical protein
LIEAIEVRLATVSPGRESHELSEVQALRAALLAALIAADS